MDVILSMKFVTAVAFVVLLSGLFFPLGEWKKKSKKYRLHWVGSQLIFISFFTVNAWMGSPTNQMEGMLNVAGVILAGLSSVLTTLHKMKPFLTKLALVMLVVYLFMVII